MSNIIKSIGIIFVAFFFPLLISVLIYNLGKYDDINRKKFERFKNVITITNELNQFINKRLIQIEKDDIYNEEKDILLNQIDNKINKLKNEYIFLMIYSNKEYKEIGLLINDISKMLLYEIFRDKSKKINVYFNTLQKLSDNLFQLEYLFYKEYHNSVNKNSLISIFNEISNYPKNIITIDNINFLKE